jgi:Caspase domain
MRTKTWKIALCFLLANATFCFSADIDTSVEENFCAEIGFKRKSKEFSDCVIEFFGRLSDNREKPFNLVVRLLPIDKDGFISIEAQASHPTISLKINDEELEGRSDGKYKIKKLMPVGKETKLIITAFDKNGSQSTKTFNVFRQSQTSTSNFQPLLPEKIKPAKQTEAVAIIIGIQNYKRLPKADYANEDARVFYDYAIRAIGVKPENIKLLVDEQADDVGVLEAFQNWLPVKVKKAKTDVFVFYSGHGLPSEDGKSLYILPFGADKNFIAKTALNQHEIIQALQAVQPKSVIMFMDACYSGQIRTGDTLLANARPIVIKSAAAPFPPEFTLFTASEPDQIASSSPELKHGIFSYYLMKGMEGDADENKDGKITAAELQIYVAEMTSKQAMALNRKQKPQMIGDPRRILITQ